MTLLWGIRKKWLLKKNNIGFMLHKICKNIISESRSKDAINKWSNKPLYNDLTLSDHVDWSYIVESVINESIRNGKYTEWIIRTLFNKTNTDLNNNRDFDDINLFGIYTYILELITSFDLYSEKNVIVNKDIYSKEYNTLESLEKTVYDAISKNQENTQLKSLKKDVDIVYEDGRWLVIHPKTHESSCHYGSGTKWCTTNKNSDGQFKYYTNRGLLLYVIDKTKKTPETLYKFAIHIYYQKNTKTDKIGEHVFGYDEYLPNIKKFDGYDEQDNMIDLKYIFPLLPKKLYESITNFYHNKTSELTSISLNMMTGRVKEYLRQQEILKDRLNRLSTSFFEKINDIGVSGLLLNSNENNPFFVGKNNSQWDIDSNSEGDFIISSVENSEYFIEGNYNLDKDCLVKYSVIKINLESSPEYENITGVICVGTEFIVEILQERIERKLLDGKKIHDLSEDEFNSDLIVEKYIDTYDPNLLTFFYDWVEPLLVDNIRKQFKKIGVN
jgi:hypothetical protein